MTTFAVLLLPWTRQYQNTAANIIQRENSTFIVSSLVGFPFPFISLSTLCVFAAEIFLGPKGKHIPSLTVVQSLTITVPPSPLGLPKHPQCSERQAVQAVWAMFCGEWLPKQTSKQTLSPDSAENNHKLCDLKWVEIYLSIIAIFFSFCNVHKTTSEVCHKCGTHT